MSETSGSVIAPTGNSFIDALSQISTIGVNSLGAYSTFLDNKALRKVEMAQALQEPKQESPIGVNTTVSDNAILIKQMALYFGGASLLIMVLLNMRK